VVLFVVVHLVGGCTRSGFGSSATSVVRLRAVRARRSSARFWFVETSLLVPAAPLSVFYHAPLIVSGCIIVQCSCSPELCLFYFDLAQVSSAQAEEHHRPLPLSVFIGLQQSVSVFSLEKKIVRYHSNFQPLILFG
jgi:hypothetical protein